MSLAIVKSGFLTTVQDLGRTKFRNLGINPGGAMDKKAVRLINVLIGNDPDEAVLEMHFPAPKIQFEENVLAALGGADFQARLEAQAVENWRPLWIEKGQTLSFPNKIHGHRIYLTVKGGFKIENWLGSKSTNLTAGFGGFAGRALQKGDQIFFNQQSGVERRQANFKISNSLIPVYSPFPTVRVTPGAEWEALKKESQTKFLKQKFSVAHHSNQMGFRLNGEGLSLSKKIELVSSAVNFGTIQLLPDGSAIILMADHQTTGGYPRIAQIISEDLPLVAQLGVNDNLYFQMISLEEAENLALEFERGLNYLELGVKSKNLWA